MKKDIKKAIIGLVISLFLFALGLVILNTGLFLKIPNEIIKYAIGFLAFLLLWAGFFLIFFV